MIGKKKMDKTGKPKYMDPKEFRKQGFLQELNRQFLFPLGLGIEMDVNPDTGEETLGRIWDCRSDPEGLLFPDDIIEEKDFQERMLNVRTLRERRVKSRKKKLGYFIQFEQKE